MTRRLTHAAALALAPASLRALNPPPRAPVAPPAPAKRPGRGSARPPTPGALPGAQDAAAGVVEWVDAGAVRFAVGSDGVVYAVATASEGPQWESEGR